MTDDKRLIEDYLPIEAISAEASREKAPRKGHISTLHLWWARRPLVACRAAVYGALVPASRFVPNGGSDEKKKSLGRANSAKFVKALCVYAAEPRVIQEAQRHILIAHADRLTQELADWKAGNTPKPAWVDGFNFSGVEATVEDINCGRAPRPRVLDMFAGGGAIPLEVLRLGCEANALDLNPVAHLIQLCTLVYPQMYGKADSTVDGMTGPNNGREKPTWGGLAAEVRYWGNWVLNRVKAEIGDLYPLIPDPHHTAKTDATTPLFKGEASVDLPNGYLTAVAYLWTRTVKCKNPSCGATVPLLKQTWLQKKKGHYAALRIVAPKNEKHARFELVETVAERDMGFDPAAGSASGNATCPFCSTVADSEYVQAEGTGGGVGFQLLALVCRKMHKSGTVFLSVDDVPKELAISEGEIQSRIQELLTRTGLTLPDEQISHIRPSPNARGLTAPTRHGLSKFSDLFQPRQLLSLLTQCATVREAFPAMLAAGLSDERARAVAGYLGLLVDRMADRGSAMCRWDPTYTKTQSTFGRPALPFIWDFSETNPFGDASGDMAQAIDWIARVVEEVSGVSGHASVERGSALALSHGDQTFDAIITDPPYYDNVPYGDLSDFFYVWLRRSIGHLYLEHFSSQLTPKKNEATALSSRFEGDMGAASCSYEAMMLTAFRQASRVLKARGSLVVVYAHKTTLGWSTLIDALRRANFTVTEAWPLNTEFAGRLVSQDSAALASSIFLVARKRECDQAGRYEDEVRPDLEVIVRERVDTFWDLGISGADLMIACVGAGLRAFTKYARVEYANGEDVPAERFLAEVETVVLEVILSKLSKTVGTRDGQTTLAGLDSATRFYVLWRYTYGASELDAGEAIIFANGTHVELDGPHSLTQGKCALLEKKKSKYRLHDYTERGNEHALGQPAEDGTSASAVDALHRLLWLLEHKPLKVPEFLNEAKPNVEQLRLVAQALGGPALSGGELSDVSSTAEQSALGKLLANWSTVMVGKVAVEDRRTGQDRLFKE